MRKFNLLASFHYYRNADLAQLMTLFQVRPGLFVDSGAFSAAMQGVQIDIREYAQYLQRWGNYIDVCCNLDVIGDPVQSQKNQEWLENTLGYSPLPVFHVGSDFKHLKDLVARYEYVALGGMVPHLRFTKRLMPWLIQCFKIAGDRARFHGLGLTNYKLLTSFPWRSVDSSAWGAGFRYGQLAVFHKSKAKIITIRLGDYKQTMGVRNDLARYNVTPERVYDRSKNTRRINAWVAANSYMDLEEFLQGLYAKSFTLYLAEDATSLKTTLGKFKEME